MRWFGKEDDEPLDEQLSTLEASIHAADLPETVKEAAWREFERICRSHPTTAEYAIGLHYLDFLLALPWNTRSTENLDPGQVESALNREHHGLERVKDRVLEYVAVRTIKGNRKTTVLIVDDERIARENLAHILEEEGCRVEMAADGEEALAKLNREVFDIILTDLKMGRVDGLQVLEQAKADNPSTEVVVITGYATVDSAVNVLRKGAYHYLPKPFKLDQVRRIIQRIEEQRSGAREVRGPILSLIGPPGTGKTSLARGIASALGRKFIRVSLAGLKDEAEIRGHRRTYAGALPGRIMREIHGAGVKNPVFLLDELDKAMQGFKGDPTSALLEVLDPEQNRAFTDHYLDLPFDLSSVFFMATANTLDPIPPALLDRMEVLTLSGYTDEEKVRISLDHVIPRQIAANGLTSYAPEFTSEAVLKIIHEYTHEAGLRNLEREIAAICRRLARHFLTQANPPSREIVTAEKVEALLGPRRCYREAAHAVDRVGVVTGLVWTGRGGELVFIEATVMKGSSKLILTGSLGEVMRESAQAALSHLRANAPDFGLDETFFEGRDIHIHVPAGAVSKDGPSAGLAIAAALLSLLLERPAKRDAAVSGELTLSGRILPVAGIREKVLAAKRGGVRVVVFPEKNRVDVNDLPPEALEGLEIVFAESLRDVARVLL